MSGGGWNGMEDVGFVALLFLLMINCADRRVAVALHMIFSRCVLINLLVLVLLFCSILFYDGLRNITMTQHAIVSTGIINFIIFLMKSLFGLFVLTFGSLSCFMANIICSTVFQNKVN